MNKKPISISNRELRYFFTHIVNLCGAGLTLEEALESMIFKNRLIAERVVEISKNIKSGKLLSENLESNFKMNRRLISLIKISENSGDLIRVCREIVKIIYSDSEFYRVIIGNIIYPTIVSIFSLLLFLLLCFKIVPEMLSVFSSLNIKLPITTRSLILLINFFTSAYFLFVLIIFIATLIYLFYKWRHSKKFRIRLEKMIYKLPMIGIIFRKFTTLYFLDNLSLIVSNKGEINNSYSFFILHNRDYTNEQVTDVLKRISNGNSLYDSMNDREAFIKDVLPLIKTAEKTGTLEKMLGEISIMIKAEIGQSFMLMSKLMEPGIMIFLAIAVSYLASALLVPLYTLTSGLHG